MSFRSLRALAGAVLTLAAIAPAAAQAGSVQVGSSAWYWGNPLPQGNTIRSMSFGPGTGYAAGDFGTLLKTTDSGASWTGLRSGTYSNLSRVQAIDSSTIVAGGGCVARLSRDGGATFKRIAFTNVESSCPEPLASFSFLSADTGFLALADGSVTSTSDGGDTFGSKVSIPGTRSAGGGQPVGDLHFVTSTIGFASTLDGRIYRTLDGASSWNLVATAGAAIHGITFADATTGYAVGSGAFLKTTDGGATWTSLSPPAGQNMRQIRCASLDLCVATTANGASLVRTDNGGTSFTTPSPSTAPIYAAALNSATQLAAGGADGTQVTSSDGGVTFAPVGTRLSGSYQAIRPGIQLGTAFALGGNGALAKTTDGGTTWTRANVTTSRDILDAAFASASSGYALDSAGGLFVTSNGASTWKTLDPGTRHGRALYSPTPATVLLVAADGLRRSTDAGATFKSVRSKAVLRKRLFGADSAGLIVNLRGKTTAPVVVYGSTDIALSTDGGKTFKKLRRPRGVKRIKSLDFVTPTLGFVIGGDGRVWRTATAGKKWTEVRSAGTNRARSVTFSSTKRGYLVVDRFGDADRDGGWLLQTDDGGRTWFPQFVIAQPIRSIESSAVGDYLLGGTGSLLFSDPRSNAGASTPSTLTIKTPKRKLKRAATIKVTGKLTGAQGSERVAVLYRKPGTTRWTSKMATVGASGTFTTSWKVAKGANRFVAQWAGDSRLRGDGAPLLAVTAKKK